MTGHLKSEPVIPAKAGIQESARLSLPLWIPAFAGMTRGEGDGAASTTGHTHD
jgi:hypothetical protein